MAQARTLKRAQTERRVFDSVRESSHQVWLAGLGVYSRAGTVVEKLGRDGGKLFKDLVAEGEKVEKSGLKTAEAGIDVLRSRADRISDRAVNTYNKVERAFQDRFERVLGRLNVPKSADIEQLTRKVKGLSQDVIRMATGVAGTAKDRVIAAADGTSLIKDMENVSATMAGKLDKLSVKTADELLAKVATPADRKALAKELGVVEKTVLGLANRVDLMRIKGIDSAEADLLERAGVDTVKELATRNADNLNKALAKTNSKKKVVSQLPSEKTLGEWIDQANSLPRALTY